MTRFAPGGCRSGGNASDNRSTDERRALSYEYAAPIYRITEANAFTDRSGSRSLPGVEMPQKNPPTTGVTLSANARTVLEKRYLVRDKSGKPTETVEEMF